MENYTVLYVLIQLVHGGETMIILNPTDSRPLYEQITEKLKDLIIRGYLKENDKVPSVRELASRLAINPNTIQKSYKQLELDGYIYARAGKGYFVKIHNQNDTRIPILTKQVSDITRELYFLGLSKNELYELIDEIYKGGKKHD